MCAIKNILFFLENLRTKTWSVCVRARSPLTLRDLTEGHRASPDICHASDQINSCPHQTEVLLSLTQDSAVVTSHSMLTRP